MRLPRVVPAVAAALAVSFVAAAVSAQTVASPQEDVTRAVAAIEAAFTRCSSTKFIDCLTMTASGGSVNGFMNRNVEAGYEAAEISLRVLGSATLARQTFDIDAASLRQPTVAAQWRSDTFTPAPGQTDAAVASIWVSGIPDENRLPDGTDPRGNAFAVMVCGGVVANFNVTVTPSPSAGVPDGERLALLMQAHMRALVTRTGAALAGAGACAADSRLLRLDPLATGSPYTLYPGDSVNVTGVVWAIDQDGMNHGPVATRVKLSGGRNSLDMDVATDAQGYFEVDYPVIDDFPSIYVTAVSPDAARYKAGTRTIQLDLLSRGALQVTIAVDKPVVAPGEAITVSGTVTAEGRVVPAILVVLSDALPMPRVAIDAAGTFSFSFVPGTEPQRHLIGPPVPGVHFAIARATLASYSTGFASANYVLTGLTPADGCLPVSARVVRVTGVAKAVPLDTDTQAKQGPLLGFARINERTLVTEGMIIDTSDSARVALDFDFGDGSGATVVVNPSTQLKIGRFCRDAAGKVHAVLGVDSLGQVAVQVTNQNLAAGPLDFNIVTPAAKVSSVQTRYFVSVDEQGGTAVAAFEGAVRVQSPSQADEPIEVPQGSLLRVPAGQSPAAAVTVALEGGLDPELVAMLGGEPAARRGWVAGITLLRGIGLLALLATGALWRHRNRRLTDTTA